MLHNHKVLMICSAIAIGVISYIMGSTAVEVAKATEASEKSYIVIEGRVEPPEENILTEDEIDLIALVTMAEAEGESELGQKLVIDTILNRVDSEHFPDTVYGVVYQRNQFSSIWNGRIDRCEVREDIRSLVLNELEKRTDTEVIFFMAGRYSSYGEPMYRLGNHYFSSYE